MNSLFPGELVWLLFFWLVSCSAITNHILFLNWNSKTEVIAVLTTRLSLRDQVYHAYTAISIGEANEDIVLVSALEKRNIYKEITRLL